LRTEQILTAFDHAARLYCLFIAGCARDFISLTTAATVFETHVYIRLRERIER
jgi:hypothetical protein